MELEALVVPLVLDSSKYVANLNGAKTTTTNSTTTMSGAFRTMGLGSVVSMLSVGAALGGIVAGLKNAVDSTLAYGDEVRKMSLLNGTTAEETSRLIQLASDYEIKQGDLEMASKTLAKQGLTLDIDTLKTLSEQYLACTTVAEQHAFLLKNFGAKGGDAFVALMGAGADTLQRQNDETDKNLILSDAQLVSQAKLKVSVKELNDKWEGVKIALGTWIIPLVIKLVDKLNEGVAAWSYIFSASGAGAGGITGHGGVPVSKTTNSSLSVGGLHGALRASGTGGNWLTVPSGYPGDSYTVGLTSGEKYNVQPAGGGGGGMDTAAVIAAIKANKIDEQKLSRSIRDAILVALG